MRSENIHTFCFIILLMLTVVSCKSKKQEKEMMQKAVFDQNIINDLPAYQNLNDLIKKNIDTIINFRRAQADHPEDIKQYDFLHDDEVGNSFIQENINFSNVPKFLLPELEKSYSAIKKGNISGYSITDDGMIDMSVTHTFDKKTNCDTYGSLVWNMPADILFESTAKDTTLTTNCKYVVHVIKRGNP